MKMKDLSRIELPREKFIKYGSSKLADHELLAILLGSGIKGLNVLELSKKILEEVNRLRPQHPTLKQLLEIKGLGKAKALLILSALEFGNRMNTKSCVEILSPQDIWNHCADIRDSKREHFVAFYLDTQNRLIERQIISIGTLDCSLVHPREVFEPAIRLCAASIIVAHNHPSGNLEASVEDREVTRRLVEAGEILGIKLEDHIIAARSGFTNLKQKALL